MSIKDNAYYSDYRLNSTFTRGFLSLHRGACSTIDPATILIRGRYLLIL
ncbi:MAG: hypothetical protein ACLP1X_35625 [Polyangiaceae bacterium]